MTLGSLQFSVKENRAVYGTAPEPYRKLSAKIEKTRFLQHIAVLLLRKRRIMIHLCVAFGPKWQVLASLRVNR